MFVAGTLIKNLQKAARDLSRFQILKHALWPPIMAVIIWSVIAWFAWQPAAAWLLAELPDWEFLSWLGPSLAHIAVFFVFAPLIYVTSLLLLVVFALPRMMTIVAARDYPDVARQGTAAAALWGSLGNTLLASVIFTLGWLLTLPLLLIPGAMLFLPLLWSAWLNQRTFRFDSLAEHALPEERKAVINREKGNLYAAGLLSSVVIYVPILNLLAPAFAALLFLHLCLEGLRRWRQQQQATVDQARDVTP